MKHPFSGADNVALREAILKFGLAEREAFPTLLSALIALLKRADPIQTISTLAWYGLMSGVTKDGPQQTGMLGEEVSQHNVELAHAILLTISFEDWGISPTVPPDVQSSIETLDALTRAFRQRRLTEVGGEDEAGGTGKVLQEHIRTHTQVVRNWGYFPEVVEISTALYAPFDHLLTKKWGFSASDAIATFRAAIALCEQRATTRLLMLQRVLGQRSKRQMIRRYHDAIGAEGAEKFTEAFAEKFSTEQLKALLLSHADLSLADAFTFDVAELSAAAEVPAGSILKLFDKLSYSPGDLVGEDPEKLFLSNPVWAKPVLKLHSDSYVCFAPQAFFSHVHSIFASLLDGPKEKQLLSDRRSKFLELRVLESLRSALPGSQSWAGFKWSVGSSRYETDALFLIDGALLIVEAKSGSLSAPALRGGMDRLKQHLKDLVFHPSEQAVRLERVVSDAKGGDPKAIAALAPLGFDPSQITRVVRLSVSLEELSVLSSLEMDYRRLGWINDEDKLSPCISIADLECILDILPNEMFIIDYLSERSRLQNALHVVGDELDWLGLYLDTGLNMYSLEGASNRLMAVGMSAKVDKYYTTKAAGMAPKKPKPRISPLWEGALAGVYERKFPGWIEVGCALLRSGNYDEQKQVASEFKKIAAGVKRNWRDPKHICAVMMTPPPTRTHGLIFFAYPQQLSAKRHDTASELSTRIFESSTADRCVVIGKRLDKLDLPYSLLVVTVRPKD
jgi:hypothetical protein